MDAANNQVTCQRVGALTRVLPETQTFRGMGTACGDPAQSHPATWGPPARDPAPRKESEHMSNHSTLGELTTHWPQTSRSPLSEVIDWLGRMKLMKNVSRDDDEIYS